jgi:hypothetical protein
MTVENTASADELVEAAAPSVTLGVELSDAAAILARTLLF